MRRSLSCLFFGVIALASLMAGPAAAQTCEAMQAELMHLQSTDFGSPTDRLRYERAYQEQSAVIARTESRARNAGCFGSGFFLFRRAPEAICSSLVPKLQEMQQNLARLDHLRRQGGANEQYRVRELEGMMSANGCDLPGGGQFEARPNDNWFYEQNPLASSYGTYRTLCVRSCDGYYFPISFSTTSDRFAEDARTCDSMCPGSPVRLFYHENPGGGPESMVSVDGQLYTSTPTAFQYRTSLSQSCTCKPHNGYSVAAAPQSTAPSDTAIDLSAPLPRSRPAPGEDPETLADRAGYFVPRVGAKENEETPVATNASGRPVRVIGPALGNAAQDALVIAPVPN